MRVRPTEHTTESPRARSDVGLTVTAVIILLALVGLYSTQFRSGAPEVPDDPAPTIGSAETRQKAFETAIIKPRPPPPTEPAPEPPGSATVEIVFPRKATLTIDDKVVGKVKTHSTQLDPGEHVLSMRLGRKTVSHKETLLPGTSVRLIFRKRTVARSIVSTATPETTAPAPRE